MNTYTPKQFSLAHPYSLVKLLHFVSQDSSNAYVFARDILNQHIDYMKSIDFTDEELADLYEMREFIESDTHNAAHLVHTMATQTKFIENNIDNAYNYIMTLLANGLPIPYDTPEIYIREWSNSETIPTFIPIMERPHGYYRQYYTQNRVRGTPNYPEFVDYEDEEFLEKISIERLPPAAPITRRSRSPVCSPTFYINEDGEEDFAQPRSLEDTFDEEYNLIRVNSK